jgi:hypothetical protein
MANTTYFGWETPDDTDLVKDGAAAIRTLGQAIDTSMQDLEGGTTGQILAKNSNADMDFIWVTNDVGDITEVVAGTGLSGGGSSGSVTLTNTVATEFDAKGDLVVGTGADTFDKLTVGANNTVLTADSSTATGLKWATPAGGGKVLQVVTASTTTSTTVASTSYTDTTLTATITPTSATSTILVMVSQYAQQSRSAGSSFANIRILRDATSIYGDVFYSSYLNQTGPTTVNLALYTNYIYRDSPATTSATTYKTQGKVSTTSDSGQVAFQGDSVPSTITLLEIGA